MNDSADPAAWLQVAETDLDMAHMALGKAYAGQAAFHVQQAVEKTLKGLLIAAGVEPPRTHDLGFLHQLAGDLPVDLEELDQITVWAVVSRYPTDENLLSSEAEIARAAELARELLRYARARLGA